MKSRFSLFPFLLSLILVPAVAAAHGPTRQKVTETIDIAAPPPTVWRTVGTFADMHWHPAVAETVVEGGDERGLKRVLKLKDGGEIKERLERYDAEAMSLFYRITEVDVHVLPITNYSSWLIVKPDGNGGSIVEWKGAFYRADPGNTPPPELDDQAAIKAIRGIYSSGLANLKTLLEAEH